MEEEKKKEVLKETIHVEHEGYDSMESYYKACESKLKEEIVDLRDKDGDFGICNDYLDYKVFELEDALEHKKTTMKTMIDKERRHGFKKMMLENQCNALEKEMVMMRDNTTHNQIHLIEYMRYTEYLKDKVNRMGEAWEASDARRVMEYQELQDTLLR